MEIAHRLAGVIAGLASDRPRLAVAFDGPDAAGKTTLAERVAGRLGGQVGGPVIRAGADGFHLPRQAEAAPEEHAHIVIGNDDPAEPVVIRWQPPGPAGRPPRHSWEDSCHAAFR